MHHQNLSMDSSYLKQKTLSDRKWCVRAAQIKCVLYLVFILFVFLFDVHLVREIIFNNYVGFHRHKQLYPPSNTIFGVLIRVQIEWNGPVRIRCSERRTAENVFKRFNCARSPFYLTHCKNFERINNKSIHKYEPIENALCDWTKRTKWILFKCVLECVCVWIR